MEQENNSQEKALMGILDWLIFVVALLLLIGLTISWFYLPEWFGKDTPLTELLKSTISNIIPVAILFLLSYLLYRKVEAVKLEDNRKALAQRFATQINSPLQNLMQDVAIVKNKIDEMAKDFESSKNSNGKIKYEELVYKMNDVQSSLHRLTSELGIISGKIAGEVAAQQEGFVLSIKNLLQQQVNDSKKFFEQAMNNETREGKLSGELEVTIKDLYKAGKFKEVVRLGSHVSRPLWLSGKYQQRVAIGLLVEDAAGKEKMYEEQATALIDDLGWTMAVMGDVEGAKRNIEAGIRKAVANNYWYLASKAERHLAGVASKTKHHPEIGEHLQKALEYSSNINDPKSKVEMQASLLLAQSEFNQENGKYKEALDLAQKALEVFKSAEGEEERTVKIYSRIGRIYLSIGDMQEAKDNFNLGLAESRRVDRPDEIGKNLLGLGDVYLKLKQYDNAQKALNDALHIFKEIKLNYEEQAANELLIRLEIEQRRQPNR